MKVTATMRNAIAAPIIKPLVLATLIAAGTGTSVSANASGDWYCGSNFSFDNRTYNECGVNFPTLDTGNDTQTNLLWLLADEGLVSFEAPIKSDPSSFYINDFPLNLRELQYTSVNQVENPSQQILDTSKTKYHPEYCNSFNTGKDALQNAMQLDNSLMDSERQQLLLFRQTIENECSSGNESANEADSEADRATAQASLSFPLTWSTNAKPYADYILAAKLFYQGDKTGFYNAHNLYRDLTTLNSQNNAGLKWLIETANYMLIRTGINRIYQDGIGDYVYKKEDVNPKLFTNTKTAIDNYLEAFPKGRYVASAQGFKRRLYWLAGQQDKLIDEIEWQISHPNSPLFNLNSRMLPGEIENKVFFTNDNDPLDINQLSHPVLLTSYALSRLRPANNYGNTSPLTLTELQDLKPKFTARPDLYEYLLATYYFVQQNNPKQALQFLPVSTPKGSLSYLSFSHYALKAKALQALGQQREADALWQRLHQLPKQPYQQGLTELAMALQAERNNDYSSIFDKKANVQSQTLKLRIIQTSADAKLLSQISSSYAPTTKIGAEARYVLLTKSLIHERYDDFLRYQQRYLPSNAEDYQGYNSDNEALIRLAKLSVFNWNGKRISPSIECQDLTTTVTRLSNNPQDRRQKICLSEFLSDTDITYMLKDYDKDYYVNNKDKKGYRYDFLGDIPSRFAGQPLNQLDIYQSVFAGNKKDELSAYAMHRAIGCFATSGRNHCSDDDVDISQRKAWFKRLKSQYSHTSWGKNQQYYW